MTIDRATTRARVHELVDLLLADEAPASAQVVDYDAMTDEELLKSDVGTRVREILFRQLERQAEEFYAKARSTSASATVGGVNLARDWVYPEFIQDGFRDAAKWDEPYSPTAEDRGELKRRIEERGGVHSHGEAEQIAMKIADEHGQAKEAGA